MKKRLFVDMDGTLAHFNPVEKLETLYEKGYFLSLAPHRNLVEAIQLINDNKEFDIYILSAVLENSQYAEKEKRAWLKRYLPELPDEQIIFAPCGASKAGFLRDLSKSDVLLDDYTVNLNDWTLHGGTGIKFVNRINARHGTWKGHKVYHISPPNVLAGEIVKLLKAVPTPAHTNSRSTIKKTVTYKIFKCPFIRKNDTTEQQIYIAAYDSLDAKALFQLHMQSTDELLAEKISEIPIEKLNAGSKCLNFNNPAKKQPVR